MALRRALSKRRLLKNISSSNNFHRELVTTTSFFRRFLQLRATSESSASFLNIPVGHKLREKLKSLKGNISRENFPRLNASTPTVTIHPQQVDKVLSGSSSNSVTSIETRKMLLRWRMEVVKKKLSKFGMSWISHDEYVRVCQESSGDHALGFEIAKLLDLSGHVIVLGEIVFLHPIQVAKSLEKIIYQSIAKPNDPRREELEEMENLKATIDQKAESLVKSELYGGLGFFIIQTLCFMRLTFWELSWDVMEPICFFTSSLYFGLAYGFFMKTSTEPSFEGYFRRRFLLKQRKLMKLEKFDIDRYNNLRRTFYPNVYSQFNNGDIMKNENEILVL